MQRSPLFAVLILLASTSHADWLTARSTYTHDAATGSRVSQYAPIETPTTLAQPISRSGFTHVRSTLNFGASADNFFRVTKFGEPVEPFAAFRFPFRPFGTPYPNWGPPFLGTGTNINVGNSGGFVPNAGFQNGGGFQPGLGFAPGAGFQLGGGQFQPGFGGQGNFGNFPNIGNGGFPANGFGGVPPGVVGGRPFGYEQPIGPLTPYPSLPFDVNRTSPIYDGHYPTYRD